MNTLNFGHWGYELARERQLQLIQEAAQQQLLRAAHPVAQRRLHWIQPLALLRTWRLIAPRLHWAGPVDEAPCN